MRGSMTERKPGVWLLRVSTGAYTAKGSAVQKSRTFHGGRREAETELGRFVSEVVAEREFNKGHGVTVTALLDRWLAHVAAERTPQTLHSYRLKIEGRLKPVLGPVRLDRLTAAQIDRAMADWSAEGLSPATVRQLYAILGAALHQAHRWGWVAEIATRRASPPSVRRKPGGVPTPDQLRALIVRAEQVADGGVLAAAIALAAATGCRRGELCALRWSDIDLVSGTVTVARSLGWVNGELTEGETKTHQVRRLAVDEFGLSIVRARMAAQRTTAALAGVALDGDPYLLSRSARGALPCLPDGLTHGFGRVARALGMPYHFHQLRHWAATTALSEGHDVRTVAGRLGHADASTTLRVYAHVVEARDQELAGTLGRALRQKAP